MSQEKKTAELNDRYQLHTGRWGMYVRDTTLNEDIDMERVRDLLNTRAPSPERAEPVSVNVLAEIVFMATAELCAIGNVEDRYKTLKKIRDYAREAQLSQQATQPDAVNRVILAGQAVVDRWETPLWKDVPATATFINELRNALKAAQEQGDDMAKFAHGPPVRFSQEVAVAAERCRQERITRKAAQEQGGE